MSTAIVAHRGFSARYTENTLAAIEAALELGVDFVEVDVNQTQDGQLVLFHDSTLNRLCSVRAHLQDVTLEQIKRLNPEIPSLREALMAVRGRGRLLIEMKRADPVKVGEEIVRSHMERNVVVFSFSTATMQTLAAAYPEIRRFGLVADTLPRNLPFAVDGIAANRRLVHSRKDVKRVQRRGWKLFVWTVNRLGEMQRLIEWGVDGLITDHPDRAKSCLAQR